MRPRDSELTLDRLRDEGDPQRRRLIALGVLTERLSAHGIEPILVGGGALEFYTAGGYATKDVDLALPVAPEVDAAFAVLGFEKEGRYWYHPEFDLLFEAPAPAGLPGEDAMRTAAGPGGLRVCTRTESIGVMFESAQAASRKKRRPSARSSERHARVD